MKTPQLDYALLAARRSGGTRVISGFEVSEKLFDAYAKSVKKMITDPSHEAEWARDAAHEAVNEDAFKRSTGRDYVYDDEGPDSKLYEKIKSAIWKEVDAMFGGEGLT